MVGLTDYPDGEYNMFKKSFENMTGQGTENEPYVITNINQLQSIKEDLSAKYTLGCDIDASETENWNDGRGFEPIGDLDDGKVEGPVDESEYSPFTGNQGESLAVHGGDESDSADTFGMLNECFKC